MKVLFVIPARGGSKGVPGKNIKKLAGKPLIGYSIDYARQFASDEFICVTSDDDEIIRTTEEYGLAVPFKRPAQLATDTAGSYEVILHALAFYEAQGATFDCVVLLQPTSPFRLKSQLEEAMQLYTSSLDMVASVQETKSNPYYLLFEETNEGYLNISKPGHRATRRQDVPKVYEFNGNLYLINPSSLKSHQGFGEFSKIKKYVMSELYSVDIDTLMDWDYAEFLIEKNYLTNLFNG
ncbi:MAG TPA: acylneuraminate cytidylyltransferase family protein [Microscillaceae bacterium]|nr:acylneuraminate cytidylyltransferase family protein [Microscillaceae bacterium]